MSTQPFDENDFFSFLRLAYPDAKAQELAREMAAMSTDADSVGRATSWEALAAISLASAQGAGKVDRYLDHHGVPAEQRKEFEMRREKLRAQLQQAGKLPRLDMKSDEESDPA